MDYGDLPGLQDSKTPATLTEIAHLVRNNGVENDPGSELVSSLLQLPEAFTASTATVLAEYARFPLSDDTQRAVAMGDATAAEEIADGIDILADELAEPGSGYTDEHRDAWDMILDVANTDVEAAAALWDQSRDELESSPKAIHTTRLFMEELEASSSRPTPGQMLLVMADYPSIGEFASELFPAAGALAQQMREALLTEKDKRRRTAAAKKARLEQESLAGRGFDEVNLVEQMLLTEDDPDAIAAVALSYPKSPSEDVFFDILEDASDWMLARWVAGVETVNPKLGQLGRFATRLDDARLRNIGLEVNKLQVEGHALQVAWMGDIVKHIYVPPFALAPLPAVLAWHHMKQVCGNETDMWMALSVALSDPEAPLRLEDL